MDKPLRFAMLNKIDNLCIAVPQYNDCVPHGEVVSRMSGDQGKQL